MTASSTHARSSSGTSASRPGVRVGIGSVLGGDPQDLKFKGEETWVEIGEGTRIREYTTINRGTSASGRTTVGKGCFLMSYVHLAHDCHLGDGVIISNGTQLAGHVTIEDRAILSGLVAVHQFVKIGKHSFVGGCSRVAKDVPPFLKAVGNPVKLYGLNSVGLQRSGFDETTIRELKRAYRLFFRSELNVSQARAKAATELTHVARGRPLPALPRGQRPGDHHLSTTPTRIGVVGAGALGYHHVRILREMDGATFVGFHDSRPERAEQVSKELGVRRVHRRGVTDRGVRGADDRGPDAVALRGGARRPRARPSPAHREAADDGRWPKRTSSSRSPSARAH